MARRPENDHAAWLAGRLGLERALLDRWLEKPQLKDRSYYLNALQTVNRRMGQRYVHQCVAFSEPLTIESLPPPHAPLSRARHNGACDRLSHARHPR